MSLYCTIAHAPHLPPAIYLTSVPANSASKTHAWIVPLADKKETLLQRILAQFFADDGTITILKTMAGKPYLAPPHHGWHLSIAHTNTMLAVAISVAPVGIDIESSHTHVDILEIAEHFFTTEENAKLAQLNAAEKTDFFYRIWTKKEASFKAGEASELAFTHHQWIAA